MKKYALIAVAALMASMTACDGATEEKACNCDSTAECKGECKDTCTCAAPAVETEAPAPEENTEAPAPEETTEAPAAETAEASAETPAN